MAIVWKLKVFYSAGKSRASERRNETSLDEQRSYLNKQAAAVFGISPYTGKSKFWLSY